MKEIEGLKEGTEGVLKVSLVSPTHGPTGGAIAATNDDGDGVGGGSGGGGGGGINTGYFPSTPSRLQRFLQQYPVVVLE